MDWDNDARHAIPRAARFPIPELAWNRGIQMIRPKILVAETEPNRAKSLQANLESAGYEVIQVSDSASAWRIIQAENLAMAFIEARLPDSHSHDLLHRVRADPNLANMPLVILGESSHSEETVEWLNSGADDYVSRSISPRLLMALVHSKLRRGQTSEPHH
jgi:DNA-binding response OmpR family regulator